LQLSGVFLQKRISLLGANTWFKLSGAISKNNAFF